MADQYQKEKKEKVIRFIKYKKHIDYENYYREKLLLYVLFENNEDVLKQDFLTWKSAYMLHNNTIKNNETKFTYNMNKKWGDLEEAIK